VGEVYISQMGSVEVEDILITQECWLSYSGKTPLNKLGASEIIHTGDLSLVSSDAVRKSVFIFALRVNGRNKSKFGDFLERQLSRYYGPLGSGWIFQLKL
jgi:hypothetical protein